MFCSTIIPTLGRSSLARAVGSVLGQDVEGVPFEVIVVNDSDRPLEPAPWQADPRVRVLTSAQPYSRQAAARNVGLAAARGSFVHFLDDDDAVRPHALRVLHDLHRRHPDAVWVYGETVRVRRSGEVVDRVAQRVSGNVLALALAGDWFPLPASLLRAEAVRAAGGFDEGLVTSEDTELVLRIALAHDLVHTEEVVADYTYGPEASSAPRRIDSHLFFDAHDRVLDGPGAWHRACASAATPYLRGALVRTYLLAVKRALRYGRYVRAARRAGEAATAATPHLARPAFWAGVRAPYRGRWYT